MKPVILIDLDKTIFNTQLFWLNTVNVLNNILNKKYLANDLANEYSSFLKDGSHYTDFSSLLSNENVDIKVLAKKIQSIYSFTDYLLPDSNNLLNYLDEHKYLVQILTIGDKEYQNLKVNFCPRINKYKTNIINYAKYKFINKNYKHIAGVLIDDKPNQKLSNNWHEIYINRKQLNNNLGAKNINNVSEIYNLDKVPKILETIYSANI